MNALVVYRSEEGYTGDVAADVGMGLSAGPADVTLRSYRRCTQPEYGSADLLVVGAPVPRQADSSRTFRRWVEQIPAGNGRPAAIFETCVDHALTGSTARPIGTELRHRGWRIIAPPMSFVAQSTAGPLAWGETGHAQAWGAALTSLAAAALRSAA